MLRQCMHVQLPRKEAEKAGMTDILIIARRVCRTKVNSLLNISCSLSGHLLTFVPAKRIPHWAQTAVVAGIPSQHLTVNNGCNAPSALSFTS